MSKVFLSRTVLAGLAAAQDYSGPAQAKRGYDLFFNSPKGAPCGTCHKLAGKGADVGPDLKNIAVLSPRAIYTVILASRTQYVVEVEPKTGESFPAMRKQEEGDTIVFMDLSQVPPVEKKLTKAELKGVKDNQKWKHPPESLGYTPEQLADIIGFIRHAGKGFSTEVKVSDITTSK
jgi:mono/diheme cytochrome c family protein